MLLWEEYRENHPDGYQYSRFCDHYRLWLRRRDLVMRQEYKAGQKMFVDYAGKTMPVVGAIQRALRAPGECRRMRRTCWASPREY